MKLKCGVIGVGHLGQYHASKFHSIESVELAGVADIDKDRAQAIAQQNSTTPYTDYRKLLSQCDAVSVAADTRHHFTLVKDALQMGIHVLVEKPLTQTVEQAQELITIAKEKQVILQVGHLERFNPAIIKLVDQLTHPIFINCQRISTFVQRAGLQESDVIIDLMIHDIDLICYLMKNDSPASIDAIGGQLFTNEIDICDARLVFEHGHTATLTTSRIGRRNNRTIKVFERGSCYIADLQARTLQLVERGSSKKDVYQLTTTDIFCDLSKDALLLEIESFVECIEKKSSPLVSGEDGLKAIELASRIRKSVQNTGDALLISSREEAPA